MPFNVTDTIIDILRAVFKSSNNSIRVDGTGSTQPVTNDGSFAQESGGHLASIDTKLTSPLTVNLPSGIRANAPVRVDYTSTNVTTTAYVQVVASLSNAVREIYIFDSSGRALVLASGAVGVEVDQIYIEPGGTGPVQISIPANTRLSVKAVDASATKGQLLLAFIG